MSAGFSSCSSGTMVGSSGDLRLNPRSISSRCSSASAATVTRGAPNPIPAQAAGLSIHAGTTMTTPDDTSTCTTSPSTRRSTCAQAERGVHGAHASDSGSRPLARHGQNDRAIAIGRKNWLFAGSDAGGETLADAMTVIETAKLAGLNPEPYLADVLARINDHLVTRFDELLPWNWEPRTAETAQAA